jgi:hypothetical protein
VNSRSKECRVPGGRLAILIDRITQVFSVLLASSDKRLVENRPDQGPLTGLFPPEAELTKAISEYHIWSAPLMLIA